MVNKIDKALGRLTAKERASIERILSDIENGDVLQYDLKKLKGYDNVFRIRQGSMRVIYRRAPNGELILLAVNRRNDTTYNF